MKTESKPTSSARHEKSSNLPGANCSADALYPSLITTRAALLLITGGYVAAYWWPAVTGRGPTGHGLTVIDRWSANATTWLQGHTGTVAVAALGLIILSVAGTITARLRRRTQRRQLVPPRRKPDRASR